MSKRCEKCQTEIGIGNSFCPTCGTAQKGEGITNGFVPTIEVARESCSVGALVSYRIFVDDKEIGRLKNGEKKRFPLESGLHEIHIKQNWSWFYSPKESFLLKDFTKFKCRPKLGLIGEIFKGPFYLLFKRHKYIELKQG